MVGSAHLRAGKLYGVSVGPGDPELMTLKAVKAIEKCAVIAAPRTKGGRTLAFDIAKSAVDILDKELMFLDIEMGASRDARAEMYREAAAQIASKLDEGKGVALLNLGDATLFGTWSHIERIMMDAGYECETVSGVTSFCASAAKLHTSITQANLPLRIIPGSYADLAGELELPGTKVIMKSASALPGIVRTLEEAGMFDHASMVVNCGLAGERVLDHVEVTGDEGYFVTILVEDVSH